MVSPKILVISNQCFSQATSNGRTLGILFKGWPKENLAQFCLSLSNADVDICNNYYSVSDKDAMKAFVSLGLLKPKGQPKTSKIVETHNTSSKRVGRTALAMQLRNIVWKSGLWQTQEFKEWLKAFNPQIVLLQSGDSAFMVDLAKRISKKFKARLVVFNTEGYIFFDHNYMRHHWSDGIAFPWFKRMYRRSFMKMFKSSDLSIYLNESLNKDYQALHPHKSVVIYNSSELEFSPNPELSSPPTFTYLGNLGIKRPEALAEFSEVLQTINPECRLDVYGRVPDEYRYLMENTPGLVYHGLVSYEKVKEIIRNSDFLVHVEKDDPILSVELRYAFSTKIADSICSGRNFIMYAPAHLACAKYIRETQAGWLASTPEELRQQLEIALSDQDARAEKISNANIVSQHNHRCSTNQKKFITMLSSLYKKT